MVHWGRTVLAMDCVLAGAQQHRARPLNSVVSRHSVREVETPKQVIEALREMGARRIGVDGNDGAGKSHLASELARELNMPHLCLDDFLEKNQGGFVNFIKYSELRAKAATLEEFVIEGVCLLDVLAKAEVTMQALVYVKRYHLGYWADERELEVTEPLEEFLAKERELLALIAREPVTDHFGLGEEIIRYHYHQRPHSRADVVYKRGSVEFQVGCGA